MLVQDSAQTKTTEDMIMSLFKLDAYNCVVEDDELFITPSIRIDWYQRLTLDIGFLAWRVIIKYKGGS